MAIDPRTPVIIGRAQVSGGPPDVDDPTTAVGLMTSAGVEALTDAGINADTLDTVAVTGGLFSDPNPAHTIAQSLRTGPATTILTTWGGNTPIAFVGELSRRIMAGGVDVALYLGGEANATRDALRRQGHSAPRSPKSDVVPELWGAPLVMADKVDVERGAELPRNNYAIFHSACRSNAGESLRQSRELDAELWAEFALVAADNPHAVDRSAMTAREIATPSPNNRMVSFPYTKALCANNRVDHAGALIIASAEAADRLGVSRDRWVFVHDTLSATDTDSFLPRKHLHEVPGLHSLARQISHRWDLSEFSHFDLYGCFPSIVRYTADALRLDRAGPLTVTGGLGFMGAPLNFAAGQSLIEMVARLRDDAGSFGLVQGNGGQAAKHSFGIYSTTPPTESATFHKIVADEVSVPPADPHSAGEAVIDGATVEFDHRGPVRAVAICRMVDGGRLWATSTNPSEISSVLDHEPVSLSVYVSGGLFVLS